MRGSLDANSLSFSTVRFDISHYSACFIPATTKIQKDLLSMIVEAVEQQKFKLGADALFVGCSWTVFYPASLNF